MTIDTERLSENMEDYLEVIFALSREKGVARVGEIAEKMDVKSSSVNAALKALAERDLVVHEKYGYVVLTEPGRKLASAVQEKHDVLYRFLTEFLMVSPDLADKEACSIEHAISEDTFIRFVKFFKFLDTSASHNMPKIIRNFDIYLKTGKRLTCHCEHSEK